MSRKHGDGLVGPVAEIARRGRERRGKAASTLRAYRADWKDFTRWCARNDLPALPATPGALIAYVMEEHHERAVSTIRGRLAAIKHYHQEAGHASPTEAEAFLDFWAGLQVEPAMAALVQLPGEGSPFYLSEDQKQLVPEVAGDLLTLRDRALILLGLFGDLRRSELVGINREDVQLHRYNASVHVRQTPGGAPPRTVTLQAQESERLCPVRSLRAWIEKARIADGPLFRSINRHGQVRPGRLSDQSVTLVVKRAAEAAGLDPSRFSAEDLRQRPAK